jgi:hypothetical protein
VTFARKTYERKRTVHVPIPEHLRRNASMVSLSGKFSAPIEKERPLRSEPYRRLVAALPCINCGREGQSQHAHENMGKGKGIKVDDRRAMPLCADSFGLPGCHTLFDNYALFLDRDEHRRMGAIWADKTRRTIENLGLLPANMQKWSDK